MHNVPKSGLQYELCPAGDALDNRCRWQNILDQPDALASVIRHELRASPRRGLSA